MRGLDLVRRLHDAERRLARMERQKKWKAVVTVGTVACATLAALGGLDHLVVWLGAGTNLIWIWET